MAFPLTFYLDFIGFQLFSLTKEALAITFETRLWEMKMLMARQRI